MQTFRTAPAPFDWRLLFATVLMIVGYTGLGLLGILWCYSDTYFGGHVGFGLQMLFGGCLFMAGWLGSGESE